MSSSPCIRSQPLSPFCREARVWGKQRSFLIRKVLLLQEALGNQKNLKKISGTCRSQTISRRLVINVVEVVYGRLDLSKLVSIRSVEIAIYRGHFRRFKSRLNHKDQEGLISRYFLRTLWRILQDLNLVHFKIMASKDYKSHSNKADTEISTPKTFTSNSPPVRKRSQISLQKMVSVT
jgi:hypothetical protein